ncbi:uncharacterized protein [Palaemon carinicauda]|uniref:uncharacterized protein n=1 Tax=Palaemon carinicauda TaxID=392227 RepID=UPI0035B69DFE
MLSKLRSCRIVKWCVIIIILLYADQIYEILVRRRQVETLEYETVQGRGDEMKNKALHPTLSKDCYIYKNASAQNICCRMHDYMANLHDVLTCLQLDFEGAKRVRSSGFRQEDGGRWLIAGDSRMRFFFFGIIRRFASPRLEYRYTKGKMKTWQGVDHLLRRKAPYIFKEDMEIRHLDVPDLKIVFYWDARLQRLVKDMTWWLKYEANRPIRLIVSTGAHYMIHSKDVFKKKGRAGAAAKFRRHLQRNWRNLNSLGRKIPVTFHFIDHFQEKLVYPQLKNVWNNDNVDYYNVLLKSKLSSSSLISWDSNVPLSGDYHDQCAADPKKTDDLAWRCHDPVHMGFGVIDQYWNMFLNDVCNKYLSLREDYC